MLWRDPADISSRDLFYGPGGEKHAPHGAFTFVKEDLDGTNPKFVVVDQDGVKWKVKMGLEARPETVASRIAWAVGYYANEDFFVRDLDVHGMPRRLQRGQKLLDADGSVHNVRLKREEKSEKKIGNWQWRHDAFTGTRELNGLKVVMALINNWDLKDENNAIYQEGSQRIYMISDLGASFGSAGRTWPREKAKDNLDSYSHSKFIRNLTADTVDFQVPARPRWVYLVNPKEYLSRVHLERIGRVPRGDARWMGQLLARLSSRQIRDAFRASGYSPAEVEGFASVLEQRIAVLTDL
ncbi:MAG TPA: hypothetical protein VNY05_36435 [Candidatus Acidoferrales bacterium]|nr:hypothetical protein [Candidatus Acidoferrales bacterium]